MKTMKTFGQVLVAAMFMTLCAGPEVAHAQAGATSAKADMSLMSEDVTGAYCYWDYAYVCGLYGCQWMYRWLCV